MVSASAAVFVRAVAVHPGEPQRHAAGVAGAQLYTVQLDLTTNSGGSHTTCPSSRSACAENCFGLPGEQLVVMPLNVLPP